MSRDGHIPHFKVFDAAILTLTNPVEFGYFIRPACLPLTVFPNSHLSETNTNQITETAGWGSLGENDKSKNKTFVSLFMHVDVYP